jgi:4-amino-4-deoxy-L-arabinose transferase-like glycosyltransferase
MRHGLLGAVVLLFVATGFVGLDFGDHWDEPRLVISAQEAASAGRLIPDWYNYPSLSFDIVLAVAHAAGVDAAPRDVLLLSRGVFLVLASLSIVWTYVAGRRLSGDIPALIGAAAVGGSWEFAYHARWVAPDALVAQFAALVLALLVAAHATDRVWLRIAGAFAAGLAMGTKYPAGLLLVPVAVSIALAPRRRVLYGVVALVAFLLAFLATTPGSILETARFTADVLFESQHYGTGHRGHTVAPGFDHLSRLAEYLGLVAFSRFAAVSAGVSVIALAGAVELARRDLRLAITVAVFPIVYVAYFSSQRVMIVRNVLCVLPFLGVLVAEGAAAAARWMERWRAAVQATAGILIAVNAIWLGYAAWSISCSGAENLEAALRRSASEAALSPFLVAAARHHRIAMPSTSGDRLAILTTEADGQFWPANTRGQYEVVAPGPFDVNLDYYPSWVGKPRIVIVSADLGRLMLAPPPFRATVR